MLAREKIAVSRRQYLREMQRAHELMDEARKCIDEGNPQGFRLIMSLAKVQLDVAQERAARDLTEFKAQLGKVLEELKNHPYYAEFHADCAEFPSELEQSNE